MRLRPLLIAAPLLLAGCGEPDRSRDSRADRDPEIAGALADPIMADPDLVSQNRGNSVLQGGGPPSAGIAPFRTSPEEIEAARAAARALAGAELKALPAPGAALGTSRLDGKLTAQAIAAALPELARGCAKGLDYGFIWAARLPAALPVYPRGHARQAAGSDAAGCRLRVVVYVTPVSRDEVLAFYATTASKAGLAPAYRAEGDDRVLSGRRAGLDFAVFARPFDDKLSEVVLVTAER